MSTEDIVITILMLLFKIVGLLTLWATFILVLCVIGEIYIIRILCIDYYCNDEWVDFTKPKGNR